MPADWPSSLPQKMNVSGFSESMGDGRIISRTDTGPGKMRRRSSAVAGMMGVAMNMTKAQIDILESWIETDLVSGSLPFTFPAPRGEILARFAEDGLPSWSPLGGEPWSVTFTLEVLP